MRQGGVPEAAARGFQASAGLYEARRPSYPTDAVAWLVERLAIGPSSVVVDLGAGTGKLTRHLMGAGSVLLAVEPLPAMGAQFRAHLALPLAAGLAEALPLRTASVDAVVVAQAFHWFDTHHAIPEIHRVLRPGGGLGLIWNMRDERVRWVAGLGEIRRRYGDIAYDSGLWRQPFEASPLFETLEERQFSYEQILDPEGVVELMASRSFIAALPPDEHESVRQEIRDLLATDPETQQRDDLVLPYRTDAYWTRRR